MNRRSFLTAFGGTAVIGGAGCIDRITGREHRLWFVRANNGWPGRADVEIQIERNGTVVHDDRYSLPGIEVAGSRHEGDEALEWDDINSALIYGEWDSDPAEYTVKGRMAGRDSWERRSFDDVETTNIGATVDIVGPYDEASVSGVRVHRFDSEGQAEWFLNNVTSP